MNLKVPLLALVVTIAMAIPASAERVDLSPQKLRHLATHVVCGRATAIYERTQRMGNWKYTHYVIEIRVNDCEKGNGIRKGNLVYARYWRRNWIGIGRMPPSTTGHRGLPSEGDSIRAYLARNCYDGFTMDNDDGGFNVIGANGFEKLK